jgi:hypothetical protein
MHILLLPRQLKVLPGNVVDGEGGAGVFHYQPSPGLKPAFNHGIELGYDDQMCDRDVDVKLVEEKIEIFDWVGLHEYVEERPSS